MDKRLLPHFCPNFDYSTEKQQVKKMKLANKQFNKSEEVRKFETEILNLKGKKREEAMKAYLRLLLSSTDQLIYFTRS